MDRDGGMVGGQGGQRRNCRLPGFYFESGQNLLCVCMSSCE